MGNTVDIIKGLLIRFNMNKKGTKDRRLLIQLRKQLETKFYEVLTEPDDDIFYENFSKLITSEYANEHITQNFFPKNVQEYAHFKNNFGFSNDFSVEIRWMIMSILFEKKAINDFIVCREKIDNYILFNRYEEALDVLEKIENKYGVSFWSMECRIFLNKKLGKGNNEIINNVPQNVFGLVLYFYEMKNRESVTSDEYYYIIKKEIRNARKNTSGCPEIIEIFDYFISGETYVYQPDKIMRMLPVMQRCSIIDRYLFVINLSNALICQPKTNYLYTCVQTYIRFLNEIEDDHLTTLRFIFDKEENRMVNYKLKSRLDNAKSCFISGNLYKAREKAVELLQLFPNNTEAMSLLVETNILIGDKKKQFENTNLGVLLDRLSDVYTLQENRDDAMEDVSKLALVCSYSTWAQSIVGNVCCRWDEKQSFSYLQHKVQSSLQHLDIETILVSLNKDESLRFISEQLDESDCYVQFRKALLLEDYETASKACDIRQIKDYLFMCDSHSISEKMEHLQPIEGTNASIAILTMKEFLANINMDEDSEIVFKIVADLLIDNIYTSLFIPWDKIIGYIDNGPTDIRKNICTPILYYVYAYYIEKSKKDDLGIICSDFFDLESIERPSMMGEHEEKYGKKFIVYFLKNVCVPKIMDDSLYVFTNTQERDQERVEICNLLTKLDVENSKEYENEIREIVQKLMINQELKIIDESRIHVNVEGIKDKLINIEGAGDRFGKSLKNDFHRYMLYRFEKFDQWIIIVQGEESLEAIKPTNATSRRLLNDLVERIRDAFVSSDEYGLNGYLSLNIRHGTLDDELRSPLYRSMLYVKKDLNKNNYIIHEHWSKQASDEEKNILQKCLGVFYQTTESILAKLKNDYIQIRTENKNDKGIFDYRFNDGNLEQISYYITKDTTFEEFFDIVINHFWIITERNLIEIKNVIMTEINQDYMEAFAELKAALSQLHNRNLSREIQQKVNEAETDMQNVLKRICYWFQRSSESKHSDFDLKFAFNLGLQTVRKMHPEKKFIVDELKPTQSEKIPGYCLKSFDGIFYNLFDNIYKKATPNVSNGTIRIGYSLEYIAGKIRIYIENDYDCSRDISADIARVDEARKLYETGGYLKRVKGEGGTGIPKICKIIKYDLNSDPVIDFGYKIENNIFYMEIQF